MFKKFALPIAVIGVIVIAIVLLSRGGSREVTTKTGEIVQTGVEGQAQSVEIGQKAPDFTLVDFSGNEVKLSQYVGKPVFIDFWASWCPPCLEEIPEIERISKEFPDLVVLGIHRGDSESKEAGEKFAQKLGVTYLLLQDPTGEVYKVMTSGQKFMPYAVFIDRNGVVSDKKAGPKTAEEMREKASKIL